MSKHNYSQYSNKKNDNRKSGVGANVPNDHYSVKQVNPMTETTMTKPRAPEVKLVEETVDTVKLPENVKGVVTNCAKLNVRAEPAPDGEIVSVLDVMTEVEINIPESTDEWFKICTSIGVEGYCMRKFIDAYM